MFAKLRKHFDYFFDAHLMIDEPVRYAAERLGVQRRRLVHRDRYREDISRA